MAQEFITIKVQAQDFSEVHIKIKMDAPMLKLKAMYARQTDTDIRAHRFLYFDQRVQDNDTARTLHLQDNAIIEVYVEQTGGSGY